jgi:myo-inositol-1(or 4)-monophosphatase
VVGGEWSSLRRALRRIAGEAAGLLRDLSCTEEYSKRVGGETIRADIESESYIIDALRAEGFGGTVITEERGRVELNGRGPIFVLDPLDGSTNYASCIPWASVSLAALPPGARSLREVAAGVVAPVFYGYPISFARGEGCYIGEERVEPGEAPRILFVYVDHPEAAVALARVTRRLGGLKVRSLGSAALEMALAGIGRAYAFLDLRSKLRNVDIAAALGITLECGGEALNGSGSPIDTGVGGVERVGTVISSSRMRVLEEIIAVLGGDSDGGSEG